MESVRGSNVLVTGAAMGLGKLFATNAVKEGAAVVILWDANETALRQTAAELEAAGGNVRYETVDVTSQDRVAEAAARVRIEGGVCALDGEPRAVEAAHVTQLVALAKTIARRDDAAPWPRRIERWRSPGVR